MGPLDGAAGVTRLTAEGVGVAHGGKTVVGAPGLAFCIAASRVAISAGEGVGSSVSGEAKTGEANVVDVLPPVTASAAAQGVGDGLANVDEGDAGVGVCPERVGGAATGAQAVAINRQAQIANFVASLTSIASSPGCIFNYSTSYHGLIDRNASSVADFADEMRFNAIDFGLRHVRAGLIGTQRDQ